MLSSVLSWDKIETLEANLASNLSSYEVVCVTRTDILYTPGTMNGHEGVRVNGNQQASFAYAFPARISGQVLRMRIYTMCMNIGYSEADRTFLHVLCISYLRC